MRELKFRAWDKKNKRWYETELPFYGFTIFGECTLVCPPRVEDLQNIEVTQFTGLKDKNGKEIYEGDIVRQREFIPNDHTITGEIVFSEGCFILNGWEQFICPNQIEVIGNIYENPELLK